MSSSAAPSLTNLAARYGSASFQESVAGLMRAGFDHGAKSGSESTWKDSTFSRGLSEAGKKALHKSDAARGPLPPLNP